MRKPTTFDSIDEALRETARLYRKALWRDADAYIEIWCEKDALAGDGLEEAGTGEMRPSRVHRCGTVWPLGARRRLTRARGSQRRPSLRRFYARGTGLTA
jgi:hypothetical protein